MTLLLAPVLANKYLGLSVCSSGPLSITPCFPADLSRGSRRRTKYFPSPEQHGSPSPSRAIRAAGSKLYAYRMNGDFILENEPFSSGRRGLQNIEDPEETIRNDTLGWLTNGPDVTFPLRSSTYTLLRILSHSGQTHD